MSRELLEKPFAPDLIKQRDGNFGKTLDYVEGHAVIQRLNDAFDAKWSFEILQTGVQTLPKLVDVGADKCIPCIKMAPILESLKDDFSGRMDVEFVDAWKRREDAARYKVQMIPTQIFYDEKGKELYRHTGFYGRKDILGKWQELGYSFKDEK